MLQRILVVAVLAAAFQAGKADDKYEPCPESKKREGIPEGTVQKLEWTSKIYPGTERSYWVYSPAKLDKDKPVFVMVFQDGGGFVRENGAFNAPVVFDNLIHDGDMPPVIGIFIDPGVVPPAVAEGAPRKNRSFEYDTLNDQYARFLLEEILPEVGKTYKLTENPDCRAICGNSSGGICAFTVAWERPDAFRKVISHIGSFTNIRGGHVYPALIRKTDPKPLRVFLQDGENDLDNLHGNWPLSNRQMAAALEFQGYDYRLVMGEGSHSGRHGGSIFADTLRWIWRDWKELTP